MRILRRVGIAIGSLVVAWLCVTLVAGFLFGAGGGVLAAAIAFGVGALIYGDILRREAPQS